MLERDDEATERQPPNGIAIIITSLSKWRHHFCYFAIFIIAATTIRIKRVIVDLHRASMPRKSAHSGAPTLHRNATTSRLSYSMRGVKPLLQGGARVANSIMSARSKRYRVAPVTRSRVGLR